MIAQHRSWLDQAWRTSCNCHRSGSCARDVQMPGVVRPGAAPTLVVASLMATRMRMRVWRCNLDIALQARQHSLQLPHGSHGSTFGHCSTFGFGGHGSTFGHCCTVRTSLQTANTAVMAVAWWLSVRDVRSSCGSLMAGSRWVYKLQLPP